MTLDKFITALAWIVIAPSLLISVVSTFYYPEDRRDQTWAQTTVFMWANACWSSAWLIARYLL